MLGANEIIEQSKKETSIPNIGGIKYYAPNDSQQQKDDLSVALNEYNKLLNEERITKKLNLSVARWDEERQMAVLTAVKGSSFQKFGFETKHGKFLYPVETLFLMDQGLLQLYYQDLPLTIQEGYILIVPLLPSFEYYQVYAYLCRLGFLVSEYRGSSQKTDSLLEAKEMEIKHKETNSTCNDLEPMISGYLSELWEGDTVPLIKPSEANSTASVLSKLQIVKPIKFADHQVSNESVSISYRISFNVHISMQQKKSDLGDPNFRVVICKHHDSPPSLLELVQLTKQSDGVNLKLAVVNQGTVSFYGIFGTDLPTLVSFG